MTRTQAIAAAVKLELDRRRAYLDGSTDISSVDLSVKFHLPTGQVRAVAWSEERQSARREQAPTT